MLAPPPHLHIVQVKSNLHYMTTPRVLVKCQLIVKNSAESEEEKSVSSHCITTCSLITALTNISTNSDMDFDNIVGNIDNQEPLWDEQACSDENDADDVRDAWPDTNSDKYWPIFWQHSDKYIDKIVRTSVQMRTMLMTSEMLWPAAAAPSRGQGLQSAREQTFTKISCSFFDIKLSKKMARL